jgi:hypothetical protein
MKPPQAVRDYLAKLGRKGGKSTSPAKSAASRANGKKGGWPKGRPRKVVTALLALLLPAGLLAQTRTNPPVLVLDAMVSFIQPAGKRALVYFRPSSIKPWQLANELPTNAIPADQAVMLRLKDVGNRTECKVEFR